MESADLRDLAADFTAGSVVAGTLTAAADEIDRLTAPQTVYVVMNTCCGSCGRVHAVFTTEAAAEEWVANPPADDQCREDHYVVELPLQGPR